MKIARLLLLLVFVGPVFATEGVWHDGDKIAPERPFQKAASGFGAQFFLTGDKSIFTTWYTSPDAPHFSFNIVAKTGDVYYTALTFFGAGKDDKGNSDVTFAGRVLDPKGTVLQVFDDIRALKGPNGSTGYDLSLAEGYLAVSFTTHSVKGVYRIELKVTDHLKKVTLPLVQTVQLK
jgi:hypothetical protein